MGRERVDLVNNSLAWMSQAQTRADVTGSYHAASIIILVAPNDCTARLPKYYSLLQGTLMDTLLINSWDYGFKHWVTSDVVMMSSPGTNMNDMVYLLCFTLDTLG